MAGILLILIFGGLIFGPLTWTKWIMRRHGQERSDFPGTGGELARHLLDLAGLRHVPVEVTAQGDHFDPEAKAVRLSQNNYSGKSVTAVAVAAHEVGHALQDQEGYQPLIMRTRLARAAFWFEQIARVVILLAPATVIASPRLALLQVVAGVLIMAGRVVINVITLPVEFDASFKRALPILIGGSYLKGEDINAAQSVLRAAAMTYLASALASLLNVLRWFRFGR